MGFWSDLCGGVRKELKPPVSGFFAVSPNAPVQGALLGDKLELRCSVDFVAKTLDRPDVLELVSRKASAMLGRPVRAVVVDTNGSGHGALASFLRAFEVDTLICGGIGGGAINALTMAGIDLYPGIDGSADMAVMQLIHGVLPQRTDVRCSHHDHGHDHDCGSHGHTCGEHGCH